MGKYYEKIVRLIPKMYSCRKKNYKKEENQ